jgi:hypothetical protein
MAKIQIISSIQDKLLDTGQVIVSIDGVEYQYSGFRFSTFRSVERANYYKPGRTLVWLKQNATQCNKLKLVKSIRRVS